MVPEAFRITRRTQETAHTWTLELTPEQDGALSAFAPGQFFAMTDDEKLASPSFEDMDAGAIFGSDAIAIDDGASIFAPLADEAMLAEHAAKYKARALPPAFIW